MKALHHPNAIFFDILGLFVVVERKYMPVLKNRLFNVAAIALMVVCLAAEIYMLQPFDRHRWRVFGLYLLVGYLVGLVQSRHVSWFLERVFVASFAGLWCATFGTVVYVTVFFLGGWPEPLGLAAAAVGGITFLWWTWRVQL